MRERPLRVEQRRAIARTTRSIASSQSASTSSTAAADQRAGEPVAAAAPCQPNRPFGPSRPWLTRSPRGRGPRPSGRPDGDVDARSRCCSSTQADCTHRSTSPSAAPRQEGVDPRRPRLPRGIRRRRPQMSAMRSCVIVHLRIDPATASGVGNCCRAVPASRGGEAAPSPPRRRSRLPASCGSIARRGSSSRFCTARRAYHLRSAGTTNQGASAVEHFSSAAWYASMVVRPQRLRSSTSPGLYFQCLSGRSSRSMSRAFCSSAEMCSITLTIVVPDVDDRPLEGVDLRVASRPRRPAARARGPARSSTSS